jgi:hypothetical protein
MPRQPSAGRGAYIRSLAGLSAVRRSDALQARVLLAGEAERRGEAFQQRQGGGGSAGLEAGDAGLGYPGPLRKLALRPAQFLPAGADGLGQLVAQPARS